MTIGRRRTVTGPKRRFGAADRILGEIKRRGGIESSIEYDTEEEIPGDGHNVVPNSEALETVFASAATQFQKIGGSDGRQQFRITASGSAGEHYVISKPLQLGGAPYT